MSCSAFNADKFDNIYVQHRTQEKLDYSLDWSEVLLQDASDVVLTSSVTAAGDLSIVSQSYANGIQKAFVQVSATVTGANSFLTYQIDTQGGRRYVRAINFRLI